MKKLIVCLALLMVPSVSSAGIVIGPGNVTVDAGDGSHDLLAVDLNNPATLGPGTYVASLLNYQFTLIPGFPTKGTITPLLLTGGGTNYTPVAIGTTITFSGATAFTSVDFGGADHFTLASSETVFPGLYWETVSDVEPRMPIGYKQGGNVFVRYQNANVPVVGVPISGGSEGFFSRTYDFSIEVQAVPAPPTVLLAVPGGLMLLACWWRRRHGAPAASQ